MASYGNRDLRAARSADGETRSFHGANSSVARAESEFLDGAFSVCDNGVGEIEEE